MEVKQFPDVVFSEEKTVLVDPRKETAALYFVIEGFFNYSGYVSFCVASLNKTTDCDESHAPQVVNGGLLINLPLKHKNLPSDALTFYLKKSGKNALQAKTIKQDCQKYILLVTFSHRTASLVQPSPSVQGESPTTPKEVSSSPPRSPSSVQFQSTQSDSSIYSSSPVARVPHPTPDGMSVRETILVISQMAAELLRRLDSLEE